VGVTRESDPDGATTAGEVRVRNRQDRVTARKQGVGTKRKTENVTIPAPFVTRAPPHRPNDKALPWPGEAAPGTTSRTQSHPCSGKGVVARAWVTIRPPTQFIR